MVESISAEMVESETKRKRKRQNVCNEDMKQRVWMRIHQCEENTLLVDYEDEKGIETEVS